MSGSYDELMGDATDPGDMQVSNMPKATQHYAGDVLPMPGERSMGGGATSQAVDYATGNKSDPKVLPIGKDTLKGFVKRTAPRYGQ